VLSAAGNPAVLRATMRGLLMLQRQHETGSDLDASLIPITVPELLRLLRGTVARATAPA
jgi:hypothetical protein